MGLSRNLNSYADVARVLRTAVSRGGARYKLDTPGQAVRWRQRAYHYRRLLAELGPTPYDEVVMHCQGPVVVIEIVKFTGELTDLAGNPVPTTEEADPLELEAEELARSLGLETDNDV